MGDLGKVVVDSFTQYAGAVLQSRALVDVRDCLKPSARQIFYALYSDKFISSKPYKKTLRAIGSINRFYIHGEASAVGVLMRAGQDFSMRYPIADIHGNPGTPSKTGNWASERYTETRLSPIAEHLFYDLEKNTITDWRSNYDDTEKYPAILPSKGFYNIVNGTMGIGLGASSSIPQFNINEVNSALITLLWNPNASFEELYCAPDFCTGGILLNESQVKESLKNGKGAACKLRSRYSYDKKTNTIKITEIPYGVYTNTIKKEIISIIESDDNHGIESVNDATGRTVDIEIYLNKKANAEEVIAFLFKETSLQSHYSINMTMLKDGRFPRTFGWKEALQEHIDHEKIVYRNGFEYDKQKLVDRIEILNGYILAAENIEAIVELIKSSSTKEEAARKLIENYPLSDVQANAILKLTLSRIASLEVKKFQDEKEEKENKLNEILNVLSDEKLFNKKIEEGFLAIKKKYGDPRRTTILDIIKDDSEETKNLYFTASGKAYLTVPKNEEVIATLLCGQDYLGVSKNGIVFRSSEVPKRAKKVFNIKEDDSIIGVFPDEESKYLVFLDDEKHFRCKEISSLNKTKTSLSLDNLVFVAITSQKVTKTNYKEIIDKEKKI